MGKKVSEYFNDIQCNLESAPPKHQHQNVLVERNWQSLICMAPGWLNSALLQSSFWFHAVKRAVEISSYLLVKLRGQITTPFEFAHHVKPDISTLVPMFSIACIDKQKDSSSFRENINSQSLYVIIIERSNTSTRVKFYHPCPKK